MSRGSEAMNREAAENERLKRILSKLAAPPAPPQPQGREIASGGDAEARLAALLTEIDETMLPRRLRFQTDSGATLSADVYGRRLLLLPPPAPEGLSADHAALIGQPLHTLPEDRLADLRALLLAFLAPASRLFVSHAALPQPRDPAALGGAAETLARLWSLPLGGPAAPKPSLALDRILETAAPKALAWLRLSGDETVAAGGEADAQERLKTFAANGLAEFRAEPAAGTPRCVVVGRQDISGALLVVAEADGETVLMLIRAAALSAVTAAWRSVLR